MEVNRKSGLLSQEKWQLAISIVFIYLPIRIYVSNIEITLPVLQNKAPFWVVEFLVNIIFFRAWIGVIEFIRNSVAWTAGKISFKLPSQLITFLLGLVLAIVFNFVFIFIWVKMQSVYKEQFDISIVRTEAEMNYLNFRQKTKANTGLTVLAMLATFLLTSNRRIFYNMQEIQLNAERLERENLQAQLMALKNQISPHFLFNSLSILTSLIESDPEKSVLFVKLLSKSYRYILEQSDFDTIKIKKELEFIETYLFLLESRFGEKLKVFIDIPASFKEQYLIAPLTLQLLIENAVKHNQMSDQNPLIVTIKTEIPYLVISNPIRLRPVHGDSTGMGLENIVNRYKLLSPVLASVEKTDGCFIVKIPLLT